MSAGFRMSIRRSKRVGVEMRADLQPERVFDAAHELDLRAVELMGARADPQEMRPSNHTIRRSGNRCGSAPAHTAGAALHATCKRYVSRIAGTVSPLMPQAAMKASASSILFARYSYRSPSGLPVREFKVPLVNPVQVGITALREGAQQVKRRRRLVIGAQHTARIGLAHLHRRNRSR